MAGMMTGLLLLLLVGVTVGRVVDLHKRIIGGKECAADDRLYHVKLYWTSATHESMWCGGSLISENWILTATHCVEPGWTLTAHLRVHPGAKEEIVVITAAPKIKIGHDIMLLELPKAMKGFETVSLPDCSKPPPQIGEEVQIAGYGSIVRNLDGKRGNVNPITLHCADTKVVAWEALKPCQVPNNYRYTQDNMITFQKPEVDISPGDSGGGVVYKNKIYGVISFMGDGAKACVAPFGATSVCHYISWIKGVTGIV